MTSSASPMRVGLNVDAGLLQADRAVQLAEATPNDPLFRYQWGLQNIGQAGGTPGVDIDVLPVWPEYTGRGVRLGVVDDGVQLAHPDLAKNADTTYSFDAANNAVGGNPVTADDNHGTSVAGIISEAQNNGIGGSGVAPDTTLISYRILGTLDQNSDLDVASNNQLPEVRAFLKAVTKRVDILNNSWGFTTPDHKPLPFASNFNITNSLQAAETTFGTLGRYNRGGIALFASGNYRAEGDDAELSNQANSRFSITVGAITNKGIFSSYSTPGADLLVAAPAGEFGQPTSPGGTIATADRTSTDGYNKTKGTAGNYTFNFNGTSAATPFVSGVVALMLQANPKLGYRDVQEILAYTARNTDPGDESWLATGAENWNGGGLHYSSDYGFGLVDAHAAVRLAESYGMAGWPAGTEGNMVTLTARDTPTTSLTVDPGQSISQPIGVRGGLNVNHVDLSLALAAADSGALTVTLTSPHGTVVPLLASRSSADDVPWPVSYTLGTDAFWGESSGPQTGSDGTWTLTITNTGDAPVAYTGSTLQVYGAKPITTADFPTGIVQLVYTNEFARMAATTPDRATIGIDSAGQPVAINAAAVSGPLEVLLPQNRAVIDDQVVQITPDVTVGAMLGGDGNDTLVGSVGKQLFMPGRGSNVVIMGSGDDRAESMGQDTVTAGAGNDTIDVTSGNLQAFGDVGRLTVELSGGSATVQAGSGKTLVHGGAGHITAWGSAQGDQFFGGSAERNQLVAGNEAETLVGGSSGDFLVAAARGGDVLAAWGENVTLTGAGSAGANTFFGSSGASTIAMGAGDDTVAAGSGAETVFGGSGHGSIFNGSGPDLVIAGSGGGYVQAGSGHATIISGTGTNTFGFVSGHGGGTEIISGFNPSDDRILLQGFGFDPVTSALESAEVAGNDTTVRLPDNTSVTFAGFTELSRSVFI